MKEKRSEICEKRELERDRRWCWRRKRDEKQDLRGILRAFEGNSLDTAMPKSYKTQKEHVGTLLTWTEWNTKKNLKNERSSKTALFVSKDPSREEQEGKTTESNMIANSLEFHSFQSDCKQRIRFQHFLFRTLILCRYWQLFPLESHFSGVLTVPKTNTDRQQLRDENQSPHTHLFEASFGTENILLP